jgi:hypothetical protein
MDHRRVLRAIVVLAATLLAAAPVTSSAYEGAQKGQHQKSVLAVVGDMPYGQTKVSAFPRFVDFVNADPTVDLVAHLGDVKAGSNSPCTNDYYHVISADFSRFQRPLIYTPGDNEWTDCHAGLKNNGLYTPTERLQAVRSEFFPVAGQSLGIEKVHVFSQAYDPRNSAYVENVLWHDAGVVFATVNVPGSNDDLDPWGTPLPADAASYPSQSQERQARHQATLAWLTYTFAAAKVTHAKGVVLMMQADLWDTTGGLNGYDELVQQIGTFSQHFTRPVLLLEGDSHFFRVDHPFTTTDPLFGVHAATPVAPNVTRLVVEGSNTVKTRFEYVRLTVDSSTSSVFSWERVDFTF